MSIESGQEVPALVGEVAFGDDSMADTCHEETPCQISLLARARNCRDSYTWKSWKTYTTFWQKELMLLLRLISYCVCFARQSSKGTSCPRPPLLRGRYSRVNITRAVLGFTGCGDLREAFRRATATSLGWWWKGKLPKGPVLPGRVVIGLSHIDVDRNELLYID